VTVDLGDQRVTRRWTEALHAEVTNREGASYKSPQAILDKLCGELTFDPLAFSRMKAAEQRDTLLRLAGLADKLNTLDATRADLYSFGRPPTPRRRRFASGSPGSSYRRDAGRARLDGRDQKALQHARHRQVPWMRSGRRHRGATGRRVRQQRVQRANARIEELPRQTAEAEKHRDALLWTARPPTSSWARPGRAAEAAVDVDFSEVEAAVAKVEQPTRTSPACTSGPRLRRSRRGRAAGRIPDREDRRHRRRNGRGRQQLRMADTWARVHRPTA
jgi:hypothetical protein